VLPYSATKGITVFRKALGRAAPLGREEMDVRSRRVSCTHASMGRLSPISEISSGEVELWLVTTKLWVVGLAAAVLSLAADVFLDFPAAGLEFAKILGSDF
jgi:hypothetical protein